jgi:hypothetical protein
MCVAYYVIFLMQLCDWLLSMIKVQQAVDVVRPHYCSRAVVLTDIFPVAARAATL